MNISSSVTSSKMRSCPTFEPEADGAGSPFEDGHLSSYLISRQGAQASSEVDATLPKD